MVCVRGFRCSSSPLFLNLVMWLMLVAIPAKNVNSYCRHDGLIEHPGDRRGHALLGDDLGEAPPNRPRARQLPARCGDIIAVVGNDAPQVAQQQCCTCFLGQNLLLILFFISQLYPQYLQSRPTNTNAQRTNTATQRILLNECITRRL